MLRRPQSILATILVMILRLLYDPLLVLEFLIVLKSIWVSLHWWEDKKMKTFEGSKTG
jgi:hypothetical protein